MRRGYGRGFTQAMSNGGDETGDPRTSGQSVAATRHWLTAGDSEFDRRSALRLVSSKPPAMERPQDA